MHDEAECIRQCQAGQAEAFGPLYERHQARVRAYLRRSGFEPAQADDLCQEVFVRAYRSLGGFDPGKGSFATWLAAIARNVARKHWAHHRAGENFDTELAEELLMSGDDPQQAAQANEAIQAVRASVRALPGDLERLVRLRYVDGRTTRGIAQALGMPEATVRQRLKEACDVLRRSLTDKGVL